MSILEKAYELGQEISTSKELKEMKNAEMAMMQDDVAQQIIKEFNERQRLYMDIQKNGEQLTESQKEDVQGLEKKMLENPLIYQFFATQQNFEKVLEEINNIIAKAISGNDHACSDDCCTSCSGCGD